MPALAQQRHRLITGIKRHTNHLGTFRNERPFIRLQPVTQLRLGQPRETFHTGMTQIFNLNRTHPSQYQTFSISPN
jgi:hypothetical protein